MQMVMENVETSPATVRGNAFRDLTGRQFGRLTAIRPTGRKSADGCYYWLCRCSCGNSAEVCSNNLLQGKTVSCGCYGRQRREESRTFVAGTCLEIVKSTKIPRNNTSGIKGVSQNRGKWLVKISFARKQFFLGRYTDLGDAVVVYKRAEAIRNGVLEDIARLGSSASSVLAEKLEDLRAEMRPY